MTTYVLILFLYSTQSSKLAAVTAEFNSLETCEAARTHLTKNGWVRAQGCFKK